MKRTPPLCLFLALVWSSLPAFASETTRCVLARAAQPDIYKPTAAVKEAATLTQKADACNRIMESEEAVGLSNRAIAAYPDFAPAYFARSEAYCALGQVPEAIADLTRVAKQKAFWVEALRERCGIYFARQQYELALADANNLMPAYSTDGTHILRAKIYSAMHKSDLAALDYSEALRQKPHDYEILWERAKCYVAARQVPKALADYNEAITLDERANVGGEGLANAQLYSQRANVYRLMGKPILAAEDERKARAKEKTAFEVAPFRLTRGRK